MLVAFSSCSSQEDTTVTESTEPVDTNEVVDDTTQEELTPVDTQEPAVESDDVLEIEIEAFNFGYSQEEIRVEVGQKVKIIMVNTGGNHDFVIDELGRTPIISTGETTEFEFTATEAGEFEYYCSVGSHRAAGMVGKLIVESS
jgi:plastocyanin